MPVQKDALQVFTNSNNLLKLCTYQTRLKFFPQLFSLSIFADVMKSYSLDVFFSYCKCHTYNVWCFIKKQKNHLYFILLGPT